MARKRLKKLKRLKEAANHLSRDSRKFEERETPVVEPKATIVVGFDEARLIELAIDVWKLEKSIRRVVSLESNRPIKSSLGKITGYLSSYGIEVRDYSGEKYYENLNVRVLSFEASEDVDFPVIVDTVRPAVLIDKKIASHASVIVHTPITTQLKP